MVRLALSLRWWSAVDEHANEADAGEVVSEVPEVHLAGGRGGGPGRALPRLAAVPPARGSPADTPRPPPGHPVGRHPEPPPISAVLLAALLATQPEPYRIDLVSITVDDARTLQGKWVRVTF